MSIVAEINNRLFMNKLNNLKLTKFANTNTQLFERERIYKLNKLKTFITR